jgi:hypothetical protein
MKQLRFIFKTKSTSYEVLFVLARLAVAEFSFVKGGLFVVAFAQEIHRLAELVEIHERPHKNKGTEKVPAPEVARAEIVADAAAGKRLVNAIGDMMMPEGQHKGEGKEGENVRHQVVHGFVPTPFGVNLIQIKGKRNKKENAVHPKGQNVEEHEFPHASVGLQLGRRVRLFLVVVRISVCHGRSPFE